MVDEENGRRRILALFASGEGKGLNMAQIARLVGLSRERVRQITTQEGLIEPGPSPVPRTGPQPRVITGGVPVSLSHTVVGSIGELLAAADLMARGRMVFFPLVRTGACDLLTLDKQGRVERIEVRCGKRAGERVTYAFADKSQSDRRAIVLTGEPVRYEPSLDA